MSSKKDMAQDDERRASSLGWLAGSTIQPKKRKLIEGVGAGTMLDLKAELYRKQEELRTGNVAPPASKKARPFSSADGLGKPTKGVQERAAKDELLHQMQYNKAAYSQQALERKAAIYDRVMRGELDVQEELANVDFLQKRYDQLKAGGDGVKSITGGGGGGAAEYVPGLVSKDMERERDRREWEENERRAAEEEAARAAARSERIALIKDVAKETQAGRSKAQEQKSERERAQETHRERLKQAFLAKQAGKLMSGNGGPGPGGSKG